MATSGVITSTMTVREVVTTALELLGAVAIGDAPPSDLATLAMKHLTWMLKTWQADGVNGWRLLEVTITWPPATQTVTLSTDYLDLMDARLRVSTLDTMLTRLSIEEYSELSNKTVAGTPTCYMVRKTVASLAVSLWPVPAASVTVLADAVRVIEDITALDQNIDVPQEWLETIYICLAARLTTVLRTVVSNPGLTASVLQNAQQLYARLRAFDQEETSVFLSPARQYGG